MFLSSATDIRVETTGCDASYFLPARPLGKLRWIGLVFIAFGLFFIWGSAKGLFDTLKRFPQTEQPGFEWIALATQLFFVVVGSLPACLGLLDCLWALPGGLAEFTFVGSGLCRAHSLAAALAERTRPQVYGEIRRPNRE